MATSRVLPNKRILRYTYAERLMHWLTALAYIYLLLTGLAFWSPRLYWLSMVLGGGPTSRLWHPIVGLLFCAALLWMLREWLPDMRKKAGDDGWNKTIGNYIRNEDDKVAPVGRFNPGQKQFFWVMFWGGAATLVSGVLLWFTEYIPWSLHWLRYLAILLHAVAALFTIGAFIIHVYMGTAVVRQGFSSVIRGEVSEDWAKTHHPLWLEEIQSAKR